MNARLEITAAARAAVEYAERGWHVFPAPPGTKQSYEKAADHDGRRWGASNDPQIVAAMFAKWPLANIGIATQESGLAVFDLDKRDDVDGVAWMQARIGEHGKLPHTIEADSPSGGWHIYTRYPVDFDPKTCAGEIAPGVDLRAHGGMVIAPPSLKPSVGTYRWRNPPGFFDVADAPPWLLDLMPRRLDPAARPAPAPAGQPAWSFATVDVGAGLHGGSDASPGEVSEIVNCIDPDCGYDDWRSVLMGLHDRYRGSDEGLAVADAWSARGQKYKQGEVAAKWRGFTVGGGSGWGSVCEIARRHGADLSEIAKRHRGSGRAFVGGSHLGADADGSARPPGGEAATSDGEERPNAQEDPDLSHDALATELGRRGWDADAKHVAAWHRWIFWNGGRWETDEKLAHLTLVRGFLRERAEEITAWAFRKAEAIEAAKGNVAGDKLRNWAKSEARLLRSKTTVAAVEYLARSNSANVAAPDDFDADLMLLGTPKGVVDLRTGALRPARREDMIMRSTTAGPETAAPERWLRFLDEVFEGDREVIAFMQRAAGYALTGMTTEHKLLFFYGTGRNGKSVFVNTLFDLWGDYARRAPATAFLNATQPKHPTDVAGLRGARLVAASELPKGRTWDESVIKDLTGGDVISARFMRGDFFDFEPQLTLMIAGNTMPSFRGVDEAIRARVVLVPFEVTIPPERRDPDLPAKLAAEKGRILQWAIDGAVGWTKQGLAVPSRLADASAEYFDDEDMLGQFLADETEDHPGGFVTTSALYDRFVDWCARQGLSAWTLMTMQKEVASRGFQAARTKSGRGFRGLRLRIAWTGNRG